MTQLALLFGGQSPEHEISLRSARNIYQALCDHGDYAITCMGIDPGGVWRYLEDVPVGKTVPTDAPALGIAPGAGAERLFFLETGTPLPNIDVFFPITHGPGGEDGTLQGMLRMLGYPFVGPDVLASAVAMDKDVAKRLLHQAGLQVAPWLMFRKHEVDSIDFPSLANTLGLPLFVKPANMGSSVGIHKVTDAKTLQTAVADAFLYDTKIIIEAMIHGRELECAVLGNANPDVTQVGEVSMQIDTEYSFDAKYESDDAAKIVIPAKVDNNTLAALQIVARQAYQTLGCEGLSRVDMFLTDEGDIFVNEVNTLPGFTDISMYPKLWANSGLSSSALLHQLVSLAFQRHAERPAL